MSKTMGPLDKKKALKEKFKEKYKNYQKGEKQPFFKRLSDEGVKLNPKTYEWYCIYHGGDCNNE